MTTKSTLPLLIILQRHSSVNMELEMKIEKLIETDSDNITEIEKRVKLLPGRYPASCNPLPSSGLSAYELASSKKLNDLVYLFLCGNIADVDMRIGWKCTVLCKTCYSMPDNIELIKLLLYKGADPNARIVQNSDSASCLISAVIHGRKDIVDLLLSYDADVLYEWRGQNSLSMAIDFRHVDIITAIENHELSRAMNNRIRRYTKDDNSKQFHKVQPPQTNTILTNTFVQDLQTIDWLHDSVDVTLGRSLGSGSFCNVYKATLETTGDIVACKCLNTKPDDTFCIRSFRSELTLMSKFRHANIITFYGAVIEPPNKLYILTELMARNLYQRIHAVDHISWEVRLQWAKGIAAGMTYLHSRNPSVIHMDLKSLNILLGSSDSDKVKVCDFGMSCQTLNTFVNTQHIQGSPAWMAPEVLRGEDFNDQSDIYSFSVILWELLTRKTPWPEKSLPQLVGLVGFSKKHLQISESTPVEFINLIKQCRADVPENRPAFKQIVKTLTNISSSDQ